MNFKLFLKKLSNTVLDILFPIQCVGCGKEGIWLCDECLEKIKIRKGGQCPICRKSSIQDKTCFFCQRKTDLDGLISSCYYQDRVLKKSIHIFKYKFVRDMDKFLVGLLIKILSGTEHTEPREILWETDYILAVPLHKKRLRWRGFNQAEYLAKRVADHFGLIFRDDIIIRQKYTPPQVKIRNYKERAKNIKGAFNCLFPRSIKNKKIILIDDVCTTLSTLGECAKVLKKAGAKEVWGLVLARG